jgi:hypothetical protein
MVRKNINFKIILLISSIGLIILGFNQIFELYKFSNTKLSPTLIIIFSILNFFSILKLSKENQK